MAKKIVVLPSLQEEIDCECKKTQKLFEKQKEFMELDPSYNSLGRKKLVNVEDKYGNNLSEIRLDRKRRIVFVEKKEKIIWLKICDHDDIKRNNVVRVKEDY